MKKILLCVPLLAIFAAGFFGCSQQRQWNHEQRKAMREALRSYRQMVYLDDLNDAEFVLFSDEVAGQLENSYPVYMEFVQMQGVDDTVDMVVVSTIVDELNADARNMRHIYPYNYLVAQGVRRSMRRTPRWTSSSTPFWPTRATCRRSAGWRASVRTTFSAGW